MIFGYLLLAHMLGDFVFQPGRLVAWKTRSKIGLAVHALIHFTTMLLLFLPFLIHGNYNNLIVATAAGISLVHFCIDEVKIHYELKHGKKALSFITDQIVHLLAIIAASFILKDIYINFPYTAFYKFYTNPVPVILLALIIFTTIGIEVYNFQQRRELDRNARLQPNYRKIIFRFLLTVIIYLTILTLLDPILPDGTYGT